MSSQYSLMRCVHEIKFRNHHEYHRHHQHYYQHH